MNARLRAQILNGTVIGGLLLIGYCTGHMSAPPPVVQEIAGAVRYVDREVIVSREPDAKVGRIESVTMPKVQADYVAIARGGADSLVNAFCKRDYDSPIVPDAPNGITPEGTSLTLDSLGVRDGPQTLLLRSVRTDSRLLPWSRSSVIAVGISGNGDLSERRYQVTPGWRMRADGDSLVVQNPRIPVKPLVGTAIIFGVGFVVGAVLQ